MSELQRLGWSILGRNHRAGGGELDIIAQCGLELRFVEVKARRAGLPPAEELITPRKQRLLRQAAEAWLVDHGPDSDVVCFLLALVNCESETWSVEWIDNPFDG